MKVALRLRVQLLSDTLPLVLFVCLYRDALFTRLYLRLPSDPVLCFVLTMILEGTESRAFME